MVHRKTNPQKCKSKRTRTGSTFFCPSSPYKTHWECEYVSTIFVFMRAWCIVDHEIVIHSLLLMLQKSCTIWDVQNLVNNGINYQPQLVSRIYSINGCPFHTSFRYVEPTFQPSTSQVPGVFRIVESEMAKTPPNMNESPLKRDHFKRKLHLPII